MSVLKAYTGDLLNRQTQKNKRRHSFFGSSEDEVLFGFSSVFDKVEVNGNDANECVVLRSTNAFNHYPTRMCNNYPRCHEHTVKLFINRISENVVHRGVMNVMTELQVDYIDNLVISVDGGITNKELDGVWRQMENEKKSGRVNSIGIADLTEDKLRHICEWSSIAPDIHQICPIKYNCSENFNTIVNLGHKYNVRTTSHGDPQGAPSKMTLDLDSLLDSTKLKWATDFTARFVQRSKDRNIITKKGYTMEISQI